MPIFPPVLLPEPPPGSTARRWHGLDLLRGVAMMLGVYLHGAIPYMNAKQTWAVHDSSRSMFFDVTVGAIHGFRMQLFFVLAGFFAGLVADRRGMKRLLWNRAWRIGVPFLAGMVLLVPLTLATWVWAAQITGQSMAAIRSGGLPTAHLWFLEYLLVYYAAAGGLWIVNSGRRWPLAWCRCQRLLESRWKVFLLPALTVGWLFGDLSVYRRCVTMVLCAAVLGPLPGGRVLLVLPGSSAAGDRVAGDRRGAGLERIDEMRRRGRRNVAAPMGQLPVVGACDLGGAPVEWTPRRKRLNYFKKGRTNCVQTA